MNDLEMLNINMEQLIIELEKDFKHCMTNYYAFKKIKMLDNNVMCCCPFHTEDRPSFGIQKSYPYRFNCFSCKEKGDIITLVSYCLKINTDEALKWLKRSYRLFYSKFQPIDISKLFRDDSVNKPILNEDVLKAYAVKPHHPWILKRRFHPEVLDKFQIGYDNKLKAITIPIWDRWGNLRYIKKRFINPSSNGSKYLNQKDVYKRDIVYPIHFIKQARISDVILCEGELNALSLYQAGMAAVAIGSSMITNEQVQVLLKCGIKRVTIFFDNDEAGYKGIDIAEERLFPNFMVNHIVFPKQFNDANDMLRANLLSKDKLSIEVCKQFKLTI